ncbi:MAG: hypothetical protein COT73_13095 [Bdellovibrio sp. CG10_big_fil_rev_8_21_14_0_10_47_8]|nr:MAG: hypothetical protein COT73_13095 [Bdellovibrio sp. CG10_big_fil_rev_8_21_14_0_10_47_8]
MTNFLLSLLKQSVLFISIPLLLSCSVYQSAGRKTFENKSSDYRVQAVSVDQATCWTQPANDPLWNVDLSEQLTVTRWDENEIRVCTLPNTETTETTGQPEQ